MCARRRVQLLRTRRVFETSFFQLLCRGWLLRELHRRGEMSQQPSCCRVASGGARGRWSRHAFRIVQATHFVARARWQGDVKGLTTFVSHMVEEATHIVVSRQMLSEFSKSLSKLPHDVAKQVAGACPIHSCSVLSLCACVLRRH